jgi:hypothetical protein
MAANMLYVNVCCWRVCCVVVQVGAGLVVQGLNATADSFYSSQVSTAAAHGQEYICARGSE